MRKFRLGVFETNSSSNHTLILMLADDYEKFSEGKLYYDTDTCKLISLKEGHLILEQIAKEKGIPIHDMHSKFQTRLYTYKDLTLGDSRLNYDSMQVGNEEVIAMTVEPRLHGIFKRKNLNIKRSNMYTKEAGWGIIINQAEEDFRKGLFQQQCMFAHSGPGTQLRLQTEDYGWQIIGTYMGFCGQGTFCSHVFYDLKNKLWEIVFNVDGENIRIDINSTAGAKYEGPEYYVLNLVDMRNRVRDYLTNALGHQFIKKD